VTFDYDLQLLGMDVTFGSFIPLDGMMPPCFFPLILHMWNFERIF
jgi:hypothetical protein